MTPGDMTPADLTPDERLVAGRLRTLADIPVSEQHVEDAHHLLRGRLRALPSASLSEVARRKRTRLLAAVAAVVLVATGAGMRISRQAPNSAGPANKLTRSDQAAINTATRFVDALSFFDVAGARRLLAPDATFAGAVNATEWPIVVRFFRETGGQILPGTCRTSNRPVPGTTVDCPYRYQLMRSGALGLGPYTGSHFRITVRHGLITRVYMWHRTDSNGFSSQMWTPFAVWIDTYHHHDGPAMYPDWPAQGHWPRTDQAIRLWSQRTRQFVHFAQHLCSAGHVQSVFSAVCARQQPGG